VSTSGARTYLRRPAWRSTGADSKSDGILTKLMLRMLEVVTLPRFRSRVAVIEFRLSNRRPAGRLLAIISV